MSIRLDKAYGSVRIYDRTRYLVLFGTEKYDLICNKVRYLKGVKHGITYLFLIIMQESRWFIWFFASRETLTFYKIIIHISIKIKVTTTTITTTTTTTTTATATATTTTTTTTYYYYYYQ